MIADIVFVLAVALTVFYLQLSLAVIAAVRAGATSGWDFKSWWPVAATLTWIAWVVIR